LYFLDLLQNASFREALKVQDAAKTIHSKQYYHWMAWRNVGDDGQAIQPMLPPDIESSPYILGNGFADNREGENGSADVNNTLW